MNGYVNIMCLYWVGDFRGRNFTEEDVWKLYNDVQAHLDTPFYFYVLTNDIEANLPGEIIKLEHDWPGWWSKMELHRGDLPPGRTLYLDLDTHVVGPLDKFFEYDTDSDLVMFNARSTGPARWEGGRKQIHRYQAAIMLFTPGSTEWFYDIFKKDPQQYMGRYRSEQDLMGLMMPNLRTFPNKWLVKAARTEKMTEKTIVVTGQPRNQNWRTVV